MTKDWFTERIGKTVVREYVYLDKKEVTEFEVTEKNAGYLWLLTEKGYTFRDAATVAKNATVSEIETVDNDDWLEAAKPTIRIHRTLQSCTACEG